MQNTIQIIALYAQFIQRNSLQYVHPNLIIVCDKSKLDGKRCNGVPDFIIEIVSPGNASDDYIRKLYYYKKQPGVREYSIVDPRRKIITVNYFECKILSVQYSCDSVFKGKRSIVSTPT